MIPDPDATNHLSYHVRIFSIKGFGTDVVPFEMELNFMAQSGWQFEQMIPLEDYKIMVVFSGLVSDQPGNQDAENLNGKGGRDE